MQQSNPLYIVIGVLGTLVVVLGILFVMQMQKNTVSVTLDIPALEDIDVTQELVQARDAQRRSDVYTLLNAMYQYAIDHSGEFPAQMPTGTAKEICRTTGNACGGLVDFGSALGEYLVAIPSDPELPEGIRTGYMIVRHADETITVSAPGAEGSTAIFVTR